MITKIIHWAAVYAGPTLLPVLVACVVRGLP